MHKDHIIPPKLRRKAGYTACGDQLSYWIITHPTEAKQRLQPLCQRHNCFKSDLSDSEARVKWIKKYPPLSLTA